MSNKLSGELQTSIQYRVAFHFDEITMQITFVCFSSLDTWQLPEIPESDLWQNTKQLTVLYINSHTCPHTNFYTITNENPNNGNSCPI